MGKKDVYNRLQQLLGVAKVISIKGIRDLDITDCHTDGVARFARERVGVISRPHIDQGKDWVGVADEAILRILGDDTDANCGRLRFTSCMSLLYANFYQLNGGVVIPAFRNEITDSTALRLFKQLYPECKIVQIGIRAISVTGGWIHRVTQQVPKVIDCY